MGKAFPGWPGYSPWWFYAANSLPGALTYLVYGLIVLWALLVIGFQYGLLTLRAHTQPASDAHPVSGTQSSAKTADIQRRMRFVITETRAFWSLITFIVITVAPALFWFDLLAILFRGRTIYLFHSALERPLDVFIKTLEYSWYYGISYIFIALVWLLLTWPALRKVMAPALELTYDVGSYFPPVFDLWNLRGIQAVFLGRGASVSPRDVKNQLAMRLRAVIAYAQSQDESHGPVAVIGHSLGSIIALSALDNTLGTAEVGAEVGAGWVPRAPQEIDLVTMGSPLRLLTTCFPHLYDYGDGIAERLSGLRRWLNLYRTADPIGREIGRPTGSDGHSVRFNEVDLCNGGHSGYFEDPRVAAYLIRWLFRPVQGEVASPILEGGTAPDGPIPDGPAGFSDHLAADRQNPKAQADLPSI